MQGNCNRDSLKFKDKHAIKLHTFKKIVYMSAFCMPERE